MSFKSRRLLITYDINGFRKRSIKISTEIPQSKLLCQSSPRHTHSKKNTKQYVRVQAPLMCLVHDNNRIWFQIFLVQGFPKQNPISSILQSVLQYFFHRVVGEK